MPKLPNPGSMEKFADEKGLDISTEEATRLYTGALKRYRDYLLHSDLAIIAEGVA